jgi:IstB-like ATP binding protein
MNNTLKQHAQTLHLSGLLDSLQLRLQEAEANRLPYAQFLELLLQDEINVRHQRLINRRHKLAEFRELRSLENFDFSFNPTINRALIYELATGHFVGQRRDVLLVGPPGVGNEALFYALGEQVSRRDLLKIALTVPNGNPVLFAILRAPIPKSRFKERTARTVSSGRRGLPSLLPLARATLRPAMVRSEILARSCFASVANIAIMTSLNGPVESSHCSW